MVPDSRLRLNKYLRVECNDFGRKGQDVIKLAKITNDELQVYFNTQEACGFDDYDSLSTFFKLFPHNLEFNILNLQEISRLTKTDFHVIQGEKTIYNVRPKYEKKIMIRLNQTSIDETFLNFEVVFNSKAIQKQCSKTLDCYYTARSDNLKRHEKICTNEQQIIDQQVAYGEDKSLILELVNLGYLPTEALQFRKRFFTAYDIETVENFEGVENMKNVEAVSRIVSIACSTNRGHSKTFIRKDSSHSAAVSMIDEFLRFLNDLNAYHDDEIPDYFIHAVEFLDLMTSKQSILPKSHKIKLIKMQKSLEKYLLQDVYGFNSGKIFNNRIKSRETKKGDVRPEKDLARPQTGVVRLKLVS